MNTLIKRIKIETSNIMIPVHGQLVRTPTIIEVKTQNELDMLVMLLRKECAAYTIESNEETPISTSPTIEQNISSTENSKKVEPLDPDRILDSVLMDE